MVKKKKPTKTGEANKLFMTRVLCRITFSGDERERETKDNNNIKIILLIILILMFQKKNQNFVA